MGRSWSKPEIPSDDRGLDGPSDESSIAALFKSGRTQGIVEKMKRKSNEWKQIPLNIGIIGSTGSGKSTLINALRRLTNDNDDAAPVGVEETTTQCTPYTYPLIDNCVLWDIPGVGTKKFPKETYLKDIGIQKYDFILICSWPRLSENDIWLAEQVRGINKKFYMLRMKIDIDLRNAEDDNPRTFNEAKVLDRIKEKYETDIEFDFNLFLISSKCPTKWEFSVFEQTLVQDCPTEKRESLILSLKAHSRKAIEQKREILRKRILLFSLASAAGGAIPIPGVSAGIDLDLLIIKKEVEFYKEQLGLTDENLKMIAASCVISTEMLVSTLSLKTVMTFTEAILVGVVRSVALSQVAETTATVLIPAVGSGIAASISYVCTRRTLENILNQMCDEACKILDYVSGKEVDLAYESHN